MDNRKSQDDQQRLSIEALNDYRSNLLEEFSARLKTDRLHHLYPLRVLLQLLSVKGQIFDEKKPVNPEEYRDLDRLLRMLIHVHAIPEEAIHTVDRINLARQVIFLTYDALKRRDPESSLAVEIEKANKETGYALVPGYLTSQQPRKGSSVNNLFAKVSAISKKEGDAFYQRICASLQYGLIILSYRTDLKDSQLEQEIAKLFKDHLITATHVPTLWSTHPQKALLNLMKEMNIPPDINPFPLQFPARELPPAPPPERKP